MDRQRLIDELTHSTQTIGGYFELSEADFGKSYAPNKWSVRQLLAHLTDCELVNLGRFCTSVAEPGSPVAPFSENDWATALHYERRPRAATAVLFRGLRVTLMHYLETLPDELLGNSSHHPEKGAMSGWNWVELAIGHAAHHGSQIEAAVSGRPWVKPTIPNAARFGA